MASSSDGSGIGRRTAKLETILARLGKEPDARLAREAGVWQPTVSRLRTALRIPPYDRMRQVLPYLGRVPDRRLSRHFGISAVTISKRRRALGIPPASLKRYNADTLVRQYLAALKLDMES